MNSTKGSQRATLAIASFLFLVFAAQPVLGADGPKWYRGQLHTHTYLSDGRGFAEQAASEYKERGYNFLSISDHNRFADNADEWRKVEPTEGGWPPKVSQPIFDACVAAFGKDSVDTRTEGDATYVRLKTYAEIKEMFEEPGKFILIPGVEITQNVNRLGLHLNYINIPTILPSIKDAPLVKEWGPPATVSGTIAMQAAEAEQAAAELQTPYLFILNHPFWVYYDTVPQNLIDCPEVIFFDMAKGGTDFAPYPEAKDYTIWKFWDAVNAFRRVQGQHLAYAVDTDDAHYYDPKRIDTRGGVGEAWVMVRAESLTPAALIEAMRKGDFYTSNGVFLADVAFTPEDKTLRVVVKPEQDVTYKIYFITTKKDFDRTVTEITIPAKGNRTERTVPLYSDDVGRTVKTIDGTEGVYQLQPDDLYVRAWVESDAPRLVRGPYYPKVKMAWTQPYTADKTYGTDAQ